VFYSLYALDRVLSAEFGTPIMMHDSDIDTCLPGDLEKHCDDITTQTGVRETAAPEFVVGIKRKREEYLPPTSGECTRVCSLPPTSPAGMPEGETEAARLRLLASNALIKMTTMTGRAMEAFNKSLKHRALDCKLSLPCHLSLVPSLTMLTGLADEGLRLRADADRWWNDVGIDSEEVVELSSSDVFELI
jgi:hypothetical protein